MADKRPRKRSATPPPGPPLSLEEQIARRLAGERPPLLEPEMPAPGPADVAQAGPAATDESTAGEDPAPRRKKKVPAEPKGLECPDCGCKHLPVYYNRPQKLGRIARVRECRNCGRRITTYEQVPGAP